MYNAIIKNIMWLFIFVVVFIFEILFHSKSL